MAQQPHPNATRDARVDRGSPEVVSLRFAKKDTKRWCRGKAGVEHVPECRPYKGGRFMDRGAQEKWREFVCKKCKKVLDYWMPILKSERKNKLAWVTL